MLLLSRSSLSAIHQSTSLARRHICQKTAVAVKELQPNTIENVDKQPIIVPDQLELINSHLHCVNQVRRYDRDNYLAALCIDKNLLKRTMFALRAFNVELSLVRDMTTNSDRAKLRFHFWSRLIDELIKRSEDSSPDLDKDIAYYKHTPVAKELLDLFRLVYFDHEIETYLRDLVGARISSKVLGYKPFDDMRELELYCSKSNASIYQLAWRMDLQQNNSFKQDTELWASLQTISQDLGIAHGLSNVIRGILYNSTKNCCYIPQDLLDRHRMTNRDFVTKKLDGEKISPVVEQLASRCQELTDKAYGQLWTLPKYFRQIFLARVSVESHLRVLKKCNYNVCDPKVNRRNDLLPLNLKLASIYFRAPIL